jgi:hypothetical protein
VEIVPRLPYATSVSVWIETENESGSEAYDDNPTEVKLQPHQGTYGGIDEWRSKSQLLVSDAIDDSYSSGTIPADDTKGDRTHRVALGGKVKIAELAIDGTVFNLSGPEAEVKVKKEITANVVKLDSQLSDSELQEDMRIVQERFAQVGLKVRLTLTTQDISQVPGLDLDDGLFIYNTAEPDPNDPNGFLLGISPEIRSIIDTFGTNTEYQRLPCVRR